MKVDNEITNTIFNGITPTTIFTHRLIDKDTLFKTLMAKFGRYNICYDIVDEWLEIFKNEIDNTIDLFNFELSNVATYYNINSAKDGLKRTKSYTHDGNNTDTRTPDLKTETSDTSSSTDNSTASSSGNSETYNYDKGVMPVASLEGYQDTSSKTTGTSSQQNQNTSSLSTSGETKTTGTDTNNHLIDEEGTENESIQSKSDFELMLEVNQKLDDLVDRYIEKFRKYFILVF